MEPFLLGPRLPPLVVGCRHGVMYGRIYIVLRVFVMRGHEHTQFHILEMKLQEAGMLERAL